MSAALDLTPVRQWSAWAATPWEDAATPVGDQGASTPEFRQPVFTQHDQQHEHKGPGSPWSPWSPSVGGWQPQLEAVDGNSSSAAQDIKQPHSDNRSAVPWKLGKLTPMSICKATPGLHASASDHSRSCQQQCSTSTPCPTTQRRVSLHHSGHMRTPGGQRAGPAGGMVGVLLLVLALTVSVAAAVATADSAVGAVLQHHAWQSCPDSNQTAPATPFVGQCQQVLMCRMPAPAHPHICHCAGQHKCRI